MSPDEAIFELLVARGPEKTICPSEAARLLASAEQDWRSKMPVVHAAAALLAKRGEIALSWKGRPLASPSGPYRIAKVAKAGEES